VIEVVLMLVATALFGCCAQLHNIYDALVDLRRALPPPPVDDR
jgi:hypothetical protein